MNAIERVCVSLLLVGVLALSAVASEPLRVSLDFFPNPNHVPLALAATSGLFSRGGIDVDLVVPANPSDPVKLAAVGSVDVAITPQINYLIARSEGLPLVAVGALVDRPLGGLLTLATTPIVGVEDLAGRRIGYSLAPLEPALWRTMLACAGVEAADVRLVNVGFNTMVSLLTGAVDAIGAFRNYEPIQLELLGHAGRFFAQEEHCIPYTYDLLFVARPELLSDRPEAVRAFLAAVAEAVDLTRGDPTAAFAAFLRVWPDLDDELSRRTFEATLPLYAEGLRHDDPLVWGEIQSYLLSVDLVSSEVPVDELYTAELLPGK